MILSVNPPYHNMIVQGVAGSGKTTVAMHRISYILYNYQERFKPDDFYIVGSNRILLNYITGSPAGSGCIRCQADDHGTAVCKASV